MSYGGIEVLWSPVADLRRSIPLTRRVHRYLCLQGVEIEMVGRPGLEPGILSLKGWSCCPF